MKDETIEKLAYWTGRLLKPVAALFAPIVVLRQIREELSDIRNIDEPVNLHNRIERHTRGFMECKVNALPNYFVHKAITYNERRANKKYIPTKPVYNVDPEITEKQLGDIIKQLSSAPVLRVSYFEQTTHQTKSPCLCRFDDYIIQFSSAGTEWCGGVRGNGYILKRETDGILHQIAMISPELSDYLAEKAEKQFRSFQKKASHSH